VGNRKKESWEKKLGNKNNKRKWMGESKALERRGWSPVHKKIAAQPSELPRRENGGKKATVGVST